MPRKKIAILVNSLAAGGAERIVANLLFSLHADYEVHLLLLRDEIDYQMPEGQIVEFLSSEKQGGSEAGSNMVRLPFVAWRLRQYCNRNGIDLLISFMTRPNFAAGLARKLGLKAKVLMSERTYTPNFYDNNTRRGKIGGYLVTSLYPLADLILPNSEGTRDALINIYGIRKPQYEVVRNQIPVAEIVAASEEEPSDVDFTPFTFIYVAGFRQEKNHSLLIDAFARLNEPNAQLLLLGKGRTLEAIREQVASLGLSDRIKFLGQKDNPHSYVARSECVVLSSNYEGFPNVLLEAMACGTAIISTDCPTGARELLAPSLASQISSGTVFHGEYGVLIPVGDADAFADAMSEMMTDASLRERYIAAGLRRVKEFDKDSNPDPFRTVIKRVLESHSL
jgi:N-acetylgalactosamine-N,N'-diacetylbacillosaminyl-diphospho-undecaprenol 4-alpha-N-acetylgalactosaminyltransferase